MCRKGGRRTGGSAWSKSELIYMIKSWGCEPLFIDNLPTEGRTIIEQLEHYIPKAAYGIVLATPDDMGYEKRKKDLLCYRARQNVVLELGMLYSSLGRKNVAVVMKKTKDYQFEKPSDIEGVLYLMYKNHVYEIEDRIKKELLKVGYNV